MIKKIGAITILLALCAPGTRSAFAIGTPSGQSITNTATATYTYGAATVTKTVTAPAVMVDNKVNLLVTKTGDLTVAAGSTNQALVFEVKNLGNTAQRYALTPTNSAGIAMGNVRIYLDNGTAGILDAGDTLYVDAATFGDVPADGTLKILIVADTPGGASGGDTADYQLTATTVTAGTTNVTPQTGGADTVGVVDVVFADVAGSAAGDGSRDGKHSDKGIYTVNALDLVLSKAGVVTWDPNNLFVTPKAIPGAIITYTINASITGIGTAAAVVITDPIPAKSTYVTGSLKLKVGALPPVALTDSVDGDVGKVDGAPVTVSVGLGDLTVASPQQSVSFDVTIN